MTNYRKSKINKLLYKIFLLFITSITIFTFSYDLILAYDINNNIQITAHRGSSTNYPDNTFLSIDEAILEGTDYIEIDVRTTKDNKVVLFHDKSLNRVAGINMKIENMTLEEIKNIDNGSYKDKLFSKEKVPTLDEVFEKYNGKAKFNIDLKVRGNKDVLPKEVGKLIKKYNMSSDVIVTCFDKDIIEKYKRDNPQSITGFICSKDAENINNINSDLISLKYDLLSKELVEKLHSEDKKIHVWTVDKIDEINNAIDLGVDNIITNNVSLVKGIIRYRDNYMTGDK